MPALREMAAWLWGRQAMGHSVEVYAKLSLRTAEKLLNLRSALTLADDTEYLDVIGGSASLQQLSLGLGWGNMIRFGEG
jgi:hypothetical protein